MANGIVLTGFALAAALGVARPEEGLAQSRLEARDPGDPSPARRRRPDCLPLRERGRRGVLQRRLVLPPDTALAPAREVALAGAISSWTRNTLDPAHSALYVQNTGSSLAQVEWVSLNGLTVFASVAEIQQEIDQIPPEADGSDATRVFRFVTDNRSHDFPISAYLEWFLTPPLFFNSVGFALCGEAAEEVNMLATDRGLSAREWRLQGHVVAEVSVAERWQMYDADYGVYFLDRGGQIASVAQLELDPSLITDPVLRLETSGGSSPYTAGYANLFATLDNSIRRVAPRATLPPRPLLMTLPRGASLRFPGRFASAPIDYLGVPVGVAYANLLLRLPAGTTGEIANPFIVHAVRGSGSLRLAGEVFEIGSDALQDAIDARTDPFETIELLEARTAVDVIYLLNLLRWSLSSTNTLTLRQSAGASLRVVVKPTGDPTADSDLDLVPDDGDDSDIVGDAACDDGVTSGCDDNCVGHANARQLDADRDDAGNACDADFDQDELIKDGDLGTLTACMAGGSPAADPLCAESDLTEDGRVDAADRATFDRLRGVPPPALGCGMGPELAPALGLLTLLRRCARGRVASAQRSSSPASSPAARHSRRMRKNSSEPPP